MDVRRSAGPSGFDALRGSDEVENQFDIVTVPELIVSPDAGGGGITDPPPAGQLVGRTGEPSDLDKGGPRELKLTL